MVVWSNVSDNPGYYSQSLILVAAERFRAEPSLVYFLLYFFEPWHHQDDVFGAAAEDRL